MDYIKDFDDEENNIAEGKAEGEMKGKLETAKAMLFEKSPIDFIIKVTNKRY